MEHSFLKREDYEESCCPFAKPDQPVTIPVDRVVRRLDEYLSRNDYDAAQRHLDYWLAEAESVGDRRGRLTVLNERIGLFRKLNRESEGLEAVREALALARELDLTHTAAMGTTLVNASTALCAFGRSREALPLYEEAQRLYEGILPEADSRLGGLYNNMALAIMDTGDYDRAEAYFRKAMDVMTRCEHGEAEIAVTCCNLADLALARYGAEDSEAQIEAYLDRAMELLDTPDLPRDGHYAFVCEKCAPVFGCHGYFLAERELKARSEAIYERA